MVFSCVYKC